LESSEFLGQPASPGSCRRERRETENPENNTLILFKKKQKKSVVSLGVLEFSVFSAIKKGSTSSPGDRSCLDQQD
jgi:hypothetical protein